MPRQYISPDEPHPIPLQSTLTNPEGYLTDHIDKSLTNKSRIRETPNLSTDADSRTNTILERLHDLSREKKTKKKTFFFRIRGCVIYLQKKMSWENPGKIRENPGKTQRKPRENSGKTPRKPRDNPGKTRGKPLENPGDTLGGGGIDQ